MANVELEAAFFELPPPSVNNPEIMARKANPQVLHNKYMWRRVRKNITSCYGVRSTSV
jgi:hypothetical protein